MAPGAIQHEAPAAGNGTVLKPTARSFHPTGTPDPTKYHAESSHAAISAEAKFAAHNYHPLPIGRYPGPVAHTRRGTQTGCIG
jgi:ornithine--oxo-acid transaminase